MSHLQRVQSFESLLNKKQKCSILWVIFPDRINHFCESKFFLKKNSVSHVEKKKKVQFCESCQKKRSSILWVIFKNQFLESFYFFLFEKILWVIFFLQKKFNSVSHILWKVQNSFNHIEKSSILWVIFKKKVQFIETYWKKKVQFFESSWKRKETFFTSESKKSCTLWDFSFDTRFNSLSHSSRKRFQFFESYKKGFNSLSHIFQKKSLRYNFWKKKLQVCESVKKKVQFFESNFKNINFKSLRQVPFFESYENSILWEIFPPKKNQFF